MHDEKTFRAKNLNSLFLSNHIANKKLFICLHSAEDN